MKKTIIIVAILATAMLQNLFAQTEGDKALQSVVNNYMQLKNALVKDHADNASIYAKTLFKTINTIPMEKLSVDQHKVWMKLSTDLSYDAEHIKGTDKIDHQREHFAKLSVNMYNLVKALHPSTIAMYYQYCPMAEEGKGAYWLSEQNTIKNPYMGRRMLTCGKTVETIK